MDRVKFTTDKDQLDLEFIIDYLQNHSYWSKGRSSEVIRQSIDHSLCFGGYTNSGQVAFGRAVTDHSTFFYLCDIFVKESLQGMGIGKKLMDFILQHPSIYGKRGFLTTQTAHQFYTEFGFLRDHEIISKRLMVLPRKPGFY